MALQSAKSAGGKTAHEFTTGLRTELDQFQNLQIDLLDAIKNGEIEPWFQPQVRLDDGRLHGAEVLARWRHPTRGLLSPFHFLPAAERAGLMIDLDHAVWAAALRYARNWQDEGVWHPCISLNVAPDTIADPHFLERFLLALQRSGLDADQVNVELLETTFISGDDDIVAINIDSLAESGVAVELDDFGTGFASFSRLAQLPLTGLKLDRSLVSLLPDQGADSIVRAILALAAELGLQVVAEGVEQRTQATHLNKRGCAVAQGFGYGKPMSPNDFHKWLQINADKALDISPDFAASA
ncbi:EAL domain-containing protein [Loktanella sp. Alg231-35]|uniref:EAL domain-containing protein n=1 Tax=Loktanella sp. Alg231-35 TaxID=1922220 RepID=UPI001F32F8B9|nr:EAL domain-containing protein [Loktanella sp. Alg231-35]